MNKIIKILLIIWQLPQTIVGLIYLACLKASIVNSTKREYATIYKVENIHYSISLSPFIFCSVSGYGNDKTKDHEYGHVKQSLILGPLYLIVIGLPSLIWAAVYQYNSQDPNGYFRFYTEKWADKLGNVVRD